MPAIQPRKAPNHRTTPQTPICCPVLITRGRNPLQPSYPDLHRRQPEVRDQKIQRGALPGHSEEETGAEEKVVGEVSVELGG